MSESQPVAPPRPAFDPPTRDEVDRVLDTIPDNRIEARRAITREWGLDPTPDELKAIVRLAHDPAGEGEAQQELARRALATRIFVERQVRGLFDAPRLEAGKIRAITHALPEVWHAVQALDRQIDEVGQGLAPAERELLGAVGSALRPLGEILVAAEVIGPG